MTGFPRCVLRMRHLRETLTHNWQGWVMRFAQADLAVQLVVVRLVVLPV